MPPPDITRPLDIPALFPAESAGRWAFVDQNTGARWTIDVRIRTDARGRKIELDAAPGSTLPGPIFDRFLATRYALEAERMLTTVGVWPLTPPMALQPYSGTDTTPSMLPSNFGSVDGPKPGTATKKQDTIRLPGVPFPLQLWTIVFAAKNRVNESVFKATMRLVEGVGILEYRAQVSGVFTLLRRLAPAIPSLPESPLPPEAVPVATALALQRPRRYSFKVRGSSQVDELKLDLPGAGRAVYSGTVPLVFPELIVSADAVSALRMTAFKQSHTFTRPAPLTPARIDRDDPRFRFWSDLTPDLKGPAGEPLEALMWSSIWGIPSSVVPWAGQQTGNYADLEKRAIYVLNSLTPYKPGGVALPVFHEVVVLAEPIGVIRVVHGQTIWELENHA